MKGPHVLLAAEWRGRLERADTEARLRFLANLPIEIDDEAGPCAWSDTLVLARGERLTVYDASYLELTMRQGASLATLDGDLAAAAKRMGVPVVP